MEEAKGKTIGEWFAPMLEQMEDTLWSYELYAPSTPPKYSNDSLRAIVKLFMSAMMDRIWELQENEEMDFEDRLAMVNKCGQEVRSLVKVYTNIDTHKLYGNEEV